MGHRGTAMGICAGARVVVRRTFVEVESEAGHGC